MSTEERDTQIEDQVDFTQEQSPEQEELTPEVNDFDETGGEETGSEMPEIPTDSTETSELPQIDQADSIEQTEEPHTPPVQETPIEISPEQPIQQSQETSSPGRVMRFEDFVNNRD
jgi:hypothetical protein